MRSLATAVATWRALGRCSSLTATQQRPCIPPGKDLPGCVWSEISPQRACRARRTFFSGPHLLQSRGHDDGGNDNATSIDAATAARNARGQFTAASPPAPASNAAASGQPIPSPHPRPDPPSSSAALPSETRSRRNAFTVQLQGLTDRLMTAFTLASHRVNTLTGTDYSAIAALRDSISQQERDIKAGRAALSDARSAHDAALTTQAASQKEVVQLLERKHSWSASDLERYMSLIRSEHTNEKSVTAARDVLESCEAELERARQRVERAERKQYHEEQIWSDTIRRNSTWVTFGLMGLNILLLIANLVIIEPWRRRRMVREIRTALDEKTFTADAAVLADGSQAQQETTRPSDGQSGEVLVGIESDLVGTLSRSETDDNLLKDSISTQNSTFASKNVDHDESFLGDNDKPPRRFRDHVLRSVNSWFRDAWGWANLMLSEEHHVLISRVDLTTAVAEAWAIGATCMLLLFVTLPIDLADVFR